MDNNNQYNGQWQQQPQQPQQQWQQPQFNGGWQQPPRPPKKSKAGLIIGIIIGALVLIGAGVCIYGYFMLGWFGNSTVTSEEEKMSRYAAEEAGRNAEEASKLAAEASKEAEEAARLEQLKRERDESYQRLKEEWDAASRRQQSRVDEIMGRNSGSSSAASSGNSSGGSSGNTASNPGIKVSGTWYGPVNEHSGDQSVVTFRSDGTVTLLVDMGASSLITRVGTYKAVKNGQYEYDDIVCHVTLSGGSGSTPNSFTFVIDPEVDGGKYAVFKESGFGQIKAGTTFTQN